MHVGGPGAQVMHPEVDVTARAGLADQGHAKGPGRADPALRVDGPKVIRKYRDNIDPHSGPSVEQSMITELLRAHRTQKFREKQSFRQVRGRLRG
jgi:hypothetical protein